MAVDGYIPGAGPTIASRTSPFDPPTQDAFVADDGPGLDTGCTFNTDPNHPLVIQIMVDRSVGPVDGNGYLLDPAPLIAAGIIPASIDIVLPAFDVDFNGAAPPERDQVLFNGTDIGLLNGDNQIWLLNSFRVDIRQVKFPAPPAPGGTPAPVANTLQVNVDRLSTSRWCTSIDWVALIIPIHPELALTLDVVSGNDIKKNDGSGLITRIYQQSFDPNCSIVNDIDNFDQYPFSGSSPWFFGLFGGEALLHSKITTCPEASIRPPHVLVEWRVVGTSLEGTEDWTGFEGDITVSMPGEVGAYSVELKFTINSEPPITIQRKLYVTKDTPLAIINPPLLTYYEKATNWAAGESDEDRILQKILAGIYGYGGANWKYHYVNRSTCGWQNLLAPLPLTCNYGDCYDFSDAFERIAATLGVGGLSGGPFDPNTSPEGANGAGFVTTGAPSLDPLFRGNARLSPSTTFDRYRFSSHSLRKRGLFFTDYYDATFNGIYSSNSAFIAYNQKAGWDIDATTGGSYAETDEGPRVYVVAPPLGPPYNSWGGYVIVPPGPAPMAFASGAPGSPSAAVAGIAFPGPATFDALDENGDGVFDVLVALVTVQLLAAENYDVFGELMIAGTVISSRPRFDLMLPTQAQASGAPGLHTIELRFSGEEIFRSGMDGPYTLRLVGGNAAGWATGNLTTPAFLSNQFGEAPLAVSSAADEGIDANANSLFEALGVNVTLNVRTPGRYTVLTTLETAGRSLGQGSATLDFAAGSRVVSILIPGQRIRRAGLDGPYAVVVRVVDNTGRNVAGRDFASQPYPYGAFEAPVLVNAGASDQGVDLNGNGLFEVLRLTLPVHVGQAGTYRISARLREPNGSEEVLAEHGFTLSAGKQVLTFDIPGHLIRSQGLDGPYDVALTVRTTPSLQVVDAMPYPHPTGTYAHTSFDPLGAGVIALTGTSADEGIDTNGNGKYDQLRVDIDVALARSEFYTWSARIEDADHRQIDFDSRSGSLSAGVRRISLFFDGTKIGANGRNGPYFVRGLLMFGSSGANLVATDAAVTSDWRFRQFEGAPSNLAPVASAGNDHEVECSGHAGTSVVLDGRGSTDPDGDPLTFRWFAKSIAFDDSTSPAPTAAFPLGTTTVFLRVSDGEFENEATVLVRVYDGTAPSLSVELSPSVLWPPNHKMVAIRASLSATDVCDPEPAIRLVSVTCSEGNESKHVAGLDIGTADNSFHLRAERSGSSVGRVYTICYESEDHSGQRTRECREVHVPHDRSAGSSEAVGNVEPEAVSDRFWASAGSLPTQPKIRFNLPRPGPTQLRVFDLAGRQVAIPVDEFRQAGVHEVDLRRLTTSQIYFYRLDWDGRTIYGKVLVVK